MHLDVALGTVNALRQEVSAAGAELVAEATVFAQAREVANADEAGWAQGNCDGTNPERRKAGLWVLVTRWVTVFQVHLSRGQAAAKALRGGFGGHLITDRWTGYGWWPLERRQVCWAPLIREFQKIAERGGESQASGEGLLEQARQLFKLWHRVRDSIQPVRPQDKGCLPPRCYQTSLCWNKSIILLSLLETPRERVQKTFPPRMLKSGPSYCWSGLLALSGNCGVDVRTVSFSSGPYGR